MRIRVIGLPLVLLLICLTGACNSENTEQKNAVRDSVAIAHNDTVVAHNNVIPDQSAVEAQSQAPLSLAAAKKLIHLDPNPCKIPCMSAGEELSAYTVPMAYDRAGGGKGIIKIQPGDRWLLHRAWDPGRQTTCYVLAIVYGSASAPQYFKGFVACGRICLDGDLSMPSCVKEYLQQNHLTEIDSAAAAVLIGKQEAGRVCTLEVPAGSTAFYDMSKEAVGYCQFALTTASPMPSGPKHAPKAYLLWPLDQRGKSLGKFFYKMGGYVFTSSSGESCPLINP